VILRHRDFMTTMNAVTSATSVGISSLLTTSRPQDASITSGYSDSWYDWDLSTEENYRSSPISQTNSDGFVGDFKEFRLRLDRSYHTDYIPERQFLQDSIIRSMLLSNDEMDAEFSDITVPTEINKSCEKGSQHTSSGMNYDGGRSGQDSDATTAPWIVFTAGVYGAGKSHTIKELQSLDCFPPGSSFVKVDPDEIRRCLPEFPLYPSHVAGEFTQKEAGMVAELLTDVALSSGKNVVVDGSLRDAAWYEVYFQSLRSRFGNQEASRKNLRIGILYVTAPADEIYQRVEQRQALNGRSIPRKFLDRSMKEVPGAIEKLKPLADFFLHVHNSQTKEEESKVMRDDLPSERQATSTMKSEFEARVFQKKCRSIVGY